jgi:translation initiation factor 2D
MDDLFYQSLLCAIKTKFLTAELTDLLPVSASLLFSNHMLPCRPRDSVLEIKKTSFKKVKSCSCYLSIFYLLFQFSKFIKSMEKKELLKFREIRNGEQQITAINTSHPEYDEFTYIIY